MHPLVAPGPPLGIPVTGIDLSQAFPPLGAMLATSVAVAAVILVMAAMRGKGPAIEEMIGALTIGTPAEPLGTLVLETWAAMARLRWYLTDALLGLHETVRAAGR